jgi:serine/threonine protein kinase
MLGGRAVVERLARGTASETLLVRDAAGVGVAKRLNTRMRDDVVARAQLEVEGRVLGALAGRGAPRLIDAGEDSDGPWLVMEHVAMPTLAAWTGGAGELALAADALLGALADVHEAGDDRGALEVVHGDVSPENVLVASDGSVARLIDFGLASFRDAPAPSGGAFRGSVRYVAPEAARGEAATSSSDLFSLGLSLLHAASGETPRPGELLAALLVQAGDVPVLEYATRASRGLHATVRDALLALVAFDPKARPRSAREVQLVVQGAHGSR